MNRYKNIWMNEFPESRQKETKRWVSALEVTVLKVSPRSGKFSNILSKKVTCKGIF